MFSTIFYNQCFGMNQMNIIIISVVTIINDVIVMVVVTVCY